MNERLEVATKVYSTVFQMHLIEAKQRNFGTISPEILATDSLNFADILISKEEETRNAAAKAKKQAAQPVEAQ